MYTKRLLMWHAPPLVMVFILCLLGGCNSDDTRATANSSSGVVSTSAHSTRAAPIATNSVSGKSSMTTGAPAPIATIAVSGKSSITTGSPAPTLSGTPSTTAAVGSAYSFQPTSKDPSGRVLTFSIQDKPTWANFNISTGQLSGTPTQASVGTYSDILISTSDGVAHAALTPFTISVKGSGAQSQQSSGDAPAYAADVGYTVNTFSANFTASSVDMANSAKSGFSWYPWNLFGSHANTANIGLNADGSVTLAGDTTGPSGELTSATTANNSRGFVGTAFGGGAYFEAVFSFDPAAVARASSNGWPAFWSLPIEGSVLQGANQWAGQVAGYLHSIEVDFFEYLFLHSGGPANAYGGSMHDWYGIYNVTCPGLCQVDMPSSMGKRMAPEGTDFTQYHRYGLLWVPATATTSGYVRFYLDGQPIGPDQEWIQFTDQPPTPANQLWAYGIIDRQHLLLILGTGVGEPLTVQSVNVWQASAAQNLNN